MKSHFTVKIPTTPLLKKFINTNFLKQNASAIKIDNSTMFGIIIISLLNKPWVTTNLNKYEEATKYSKFTDNIICVGPLSLMSHYGTEITMQQCIQINRHFDEMLNYELYLFCKKNVDESKRYSGYDKILNTFANSYNIIIDQDITFDGLKKREYRFRKEKEKKLIGVLSSQKHTNNPSQSQLILV